MMIKFIRDINKWNRKPRKRFFTVSDYAVIFFV